MQLELFQNFIDNVSSFNAVRTHLSARQAIKSLIYLPC